MTIGHCAQHRFDGTAFVCGVRAATRKSAAHRYIHRARRVPLQSDAVTTATGLGIKARCGRPQRSRIGVQWIREQGIAGRLLDYSAQIHHSDFVTNMANNAQIVADKEVG